MKHLFFIRREDYWIHFLAGLSVIFGASALYAEVIYIRFSTAVAALGLWWFLTYIIRKNYSKRQATIFLTVHVLLAVVFAYLIYLLTN